MANVIYNALETAVLKADIDFESNTIKAMLVTSAYTPDQNAHDFINDVSNEVSGTVYTAGGGALGSKTVTRDNTNNRGVFDAADVTWSSSTITTRGAMLYKDISNASTSLIIEYFDFGSD